MYSSASIIRAVAIIAVAGTVVLYEATHEFGGYRPKASFKESLGVVRQFGIVAANYLREKFLFSHRQWLGVSIVVLGLS